MKKPLLFFFVLSLVVSCSRQSYYQTGDLLFVEGTASSAMDQAIMGSTGAMVHVGIVEVVGDSVFVIDAAPQTGVSRRPLDAFLEAQKDYEGRLPALHLMRLKNNREAASFVAQAKSLCGAEYDFSFMPDNKKYYCSELVHVCYQRKGEPLFEAVPMNFKNEEGGYDEFWVRLFVKQGMVIPQGVLGTNPDAMFQSNLLMHVEPRHGTTLHD